MTICHLMETQNLVISFDYSWFLAKNLAYAEYLIMKFHYRNSSSLQYVITKNENNKFWIFTNLLTNQIIFQQQKKCILNIYWPCVIDDPDLNLTSQHYQLQQQPRSRLRSISPHMPPSTYRPSSSATNTQWVIWLGKILIKSVCMWSDCLYLKYIYIYCKSHK